MKHEAFTNKYTIAYLKDLLGSMTQCRDLYIQMCKKTEKHFVPDIKDPNTSEGSMTLCIEFLTDIIQTKYIAYKVQDGSTRKLIDKQIDRAEKIYQRNRLAKIADLLDE